MTPQYDKAFTDVIQGLLNWRMWVRLGWQENKRRYRRTVLGPFWTTLSVGVFIVTLGFVWSQLWKQDPKVYLPFLASGMVVWALVGTVITEGCQVFIAAENLIKSLKINYTVLACAVMWRNVVVLAHNVVIFVLVAIYGDVSLNWQTLLALPGLLLVAMNGIWMCLLLGLLCSRFRDIQQVITTMLQVAMFVTPIFWSADQLGARFKSVVDFNLLYHLVDVVRAPLLGHAPSSRTYLSVMAAAFLGWSLTIVVFSRFRRRIPYWL
ncbi:MAG: ABC transporter permease [Nitrospirota bacterium]